MPPATVMGAQSNTVDDESLRKNEEWRLVGYGNKSPRRVSPLASTAEAATSVSPSRFHILDEVEEGEVVADESSSEEDDSVASADFPKDTFKIVKDTEKAKSKKGNKANTQAPKDQKKNAQSAKTKNASSRKH